MSAALAGDQPAKLWGLSPWSAAILLAMANFLAPNRRRYGRRAKR